MLTSPSAAGNDWTAAATGYVKNSLTPHYTFVAQLSQLPVMDGVLSSEYDQPGHYASRAFDGTTTSFASTAGEYIAP
mgnify:FL=1